MKRFRRNKPIPTLFFWTGVAALLIILPLPGILLDGRTLAPYLEFPPLTHYVAHTGFNWRVFCIFSAINLAMLIMLAAFIYPALSEAHIPRKRPARFPIWGWAGAAIMLAGWLLAWTRFSWFVPLQKHTFILPWLGYILLVNALCVQRSNASLLTDNPGRFAMLFPASALFWWFFEYLNRFVQNWYYIGVNDFGPVSYTLFATLAFVTVLPAVLSTYRWLLTFRPLNHGLTNRLTMRPARPRAIAGAAFATSAAGLALIGVLPNYLFALVWFAPLMLIAALQGLCGRPTIFRGLYNGDWRPVVVPALAALVCGFFWELWNIGSLARWEYAIPFVDRYHLFAMPILGYGGYLPFGLECLVIGRIVMGGRETPRV